MSFPVQRHFGLVLLFNLLSLGLYQLFYTHRLFKAADQRRDVPFMAPLFWSALVLTVLFVSSLFLSLPVAAAQETGTGQPTWTVGPSPRDAPEPTSWVALLAVVSGMAWAAFFMLELARFHPRIVSPFGIPAVLVAGTILDLMAAHGAVLRVAEVLLAFFGLVAFYELHWKMREWFDAPLDNEADEPVTPAYAGTA